MPDTNVSINLIFLFTLKVLGVFFSLFIFQKFTPLVDANLYLDHFYIKSAETRTFLVQKIVLLLSGFNDFFIHLTFALISSLGFIYGIIKFNIKSIFLISLILPSSLVWTSVVGKEAIFFGFFTLLLFIWNSILTNRFNFYDLLFVIVSIILCLIFRPHYLIGVLWLYYSLLIIKFFPFYKRITLILSFLILTFVCFFVFYSDGILWRAVSSIEFDGRSSRFNYYNLLNPHVYSELYMQKKILLEFKFALLRDWIFSFIGPMPYEMLKRYEFIPFFIEGVTILTFPLIVYLYSLIYHNVKVNNLTILFFYSLTPALLILILIHAPFGLMNPGTGIRWRVNFEAIFYITPLLIFFNYKYLKIK